MLPNETFLQITNCKEDIAFANNIQVDLIDTCQNVVKNLIVNENFFYNEFTDIKGVKQIAYEFGNIGEDFYGELIFLRLKHTVSDNIWYSNGFLITENLKEETSLFIYKSEGYFKGIDYSNQPYFQRIRLTCFKTDIDPQTEAEDLTQISGNRYGLRPITTPIDKYLFYTCDFFTYNRMVALLSHPIVYINGFRANTKANDLTKGERITDTNIFDANFSANPTEEESNVGYQIYQALEVVGKVPSGDYLLADYNTATATSTLYTISFNKPFAIASDISLKLYQDNVLVHTFDHTKFSISGQNLNIDVSDYPISDSANYKCAIEQNKVFTTGVSIVEYWIGYAYGGWDFKIVDGDYDENDYDSTDYLTSN